MLIAWRPLGMGDARRGKSEADKEPLVANLAKKYHKTPAQIALNWLLSQTNVVTLFKSSEPEHIKNNLGAVGWEMEKADIEKLRSEFPGQQFISDTVPLA